MNYQGTIGRTQVIQIDQNNARIDLDTGLIDFFSSTFLAGTYNEVTVDEFGRVIAGAFVIPTPIVLPPKTNPPIIYTLDPNAEGLVPLDLTLPCVAYSLSGEYAMMGWNPDTQTWV
jgi:hypothetical protein